jgi:hypothetical protein
MPIETSTKLYVREFGFRTVAIMYYEIPKQNKIFFDTIHLYCPFNYNLCNGAMYEKYQSMQNVSVETP